MLIIVADRDRLVVEKLDRRQRQPAVADVALRFAEIDAAVEQVLESHDLPSAESPAPGLSVTERQALERGGFSITPMNAHEQSPTFAASVDYATLVGDSYTTDEAAKKLKVNASRIRQRLAARELYGIKDRRGWRIPRFQFAGARLIPHIDDVLPRLPADLHPIAVYRWFTSPNPDLTQEDLNDLDATAEVHEEEVAPLSPLGWLRRGLPAGIVAELASTL